MPCRLLLSCVLLALLAGGARGESDLLPAGSINAALAGDAKVVIFEDHPVVRAHATAIAAKFFPDATLMTGAEALEADLAGKTLIVYATLDDPWLAALAPRLPFRYEGGRLMVEEIANFPAGGRLRLIGALRNPFDPSRRMVLYHARAPEHLREVNRVFHGPTEWVVAEGDDVKGQGSFGSDDPMPVEWLERDLDALLEAVRAVHPAAADGLPPAVREAADAARARLDAPMSRSDLWYVLQPVLVALGDAHSSFDTPPSDGAYRFDVRWLADGLYVDEDSRSPELRVGDRVVSIAGRTPDDVLDALRPFIAAENDHWRRHRARTLLRHPRLLHAAGIVDGPRARLPVTVERYGREVEVQLGVGQGPTMRRTAPKRRFVGGWIHRDASLGVFHVDECRIDDVYRRHLDLFFRDVERSGVERIAVDVRWNTGGNSAVVNEFLRYLDVESYVSYGGDVRVSAPDYRPGEPYSDEGLRAFPPSARTNDRVTEPPPFAGEVYVITGPATFSSGNWFAVILGDNDLATVIGEPTGNAPSSYGDLRPLSLPESGLGYALSYKAWKRPDPARDPADTLAPDVLVPTTRADLAADEDPVLEYLRALDR